MANMTNRTLLFETLVTPQLIGGWTLDELIAQADGFLPPNAFAGIHDQPNVTVTVEHFGDTDHPVLLRWWRDA